MGGLIYIIHIVSPSTLGGGGGGVRLHHQSVSLYLGGRGSFASSESLPLPWVEVREELICIVRVSPCTLGGGGGGARLHRLSVSLYLGGRGSFASSECVSLPRVEVGVGLIYIIHIVSPSTLGGDGGGVRLHRQRVSLYLGWRWEGGACLHHQSVSLYLGGRACLHIQRVFLYLGWR